MKNYIKIKAAAKAEHIQRLKSNIKDIRSRENISTCYYYKLLTKRELEKLTEKQQRARIIEKLNKKCKKDIENDFLICDKIAAAPDLISVEITVEWKNNKTWGANPTATARILTANGWTRTTSRSIGGCGYDKGSTAVAEALNCCISVRKVLFDAAEKIRRKNKTAVMVDRVLPYGSGYSPMPYLEGGVGVSSYIDIFSVCGYEFKTIASGKMFDVYTITKIQRGKRQ